MAKLLECGPLLILPILGASLLTGCGHSEPLHTTSALARVNQSQNLPFHPETESAGGDPSQQELPADAKQASTLPFRTAAHPRILPSGTLLTVDLQASLSTAKVHPGDTFTATVAAPLIIDGATLIESGTPVTGRVESEQSQVRSAGASGSSGYFRLTLSTMSVEGRPIVLQTSSLFARGTLLHPHSAAGASVAEMKSGGMRVQKGRPLTFRLTAPVALAESQPKTQS